MQRDAFNQTIIKHDCKHHKCYSKHLFFQLSIMQCSNLLQVLQRYNKINSINKKHMINDFHHSSNAKESLA